jgi:hypothetical protein
MKNNKRKIVCLMSIFLLLPLHVALAQGNLTEYIQTFQQERNSINQTAMLVLGSWAVGNILVGSYGNFNAKDEAKYFHQFNAMWNVVNAGIATFGYINAANSNPATMTSTEILKDFNSLQNFLLLNAGLDVAYISVGLYLRERAKNSSNVSRLRGYGNSLLLQGGFLLLFDVTLFFIHQNNAAVQLYPQIESLIAGGIGMGLKIRL